MIFCVCLLAILCLFSCILFIIIFLMPSTAPWGEMHGVFEVTMEHGGSGRRWVGTGCVFAASWWSSHRVETKMAWLLHLETENRQEGNEKMRAMADKKKALGVERDEAWGRGGQRRHCGGRGKVSWAWKNAEGACFLWGSGQQGIGTEGCKCSSITDTQSAVENGGDEIKHSLNSLTHSLTHPLTQYVFIEYWQCASPELKA